MAVITPSSEGLRNLFDIMCERQDLAARVRDHGDERTHGGLCTRTGLRTPNRGREASDAGLLAALVAWRTGLKATEGWTTQSKVRHNENG